MASTIVDAALAASLLLLGALALRYRRRKQPSRTLRVALGACLTWLAYALLQLSRDGPVSTGTVLNYGVDALAVVALVAGLVLLYRGWRYGDGNPETATADG